MLLNEKEEENIESGKYIDNLMEILNLKMYLGIKIEYINEGEESKMATTNEFIEYVCEQINGIGNIRYKKMFGEYMIYVNEKPVIIVCDNTAFVKKLDSIEKEMENAKTGYPYKGAKEHYVLDIDNSDFCKFIVTQIEKVTPMPKPRKK